MTGCSGLTTGVLVLPSFLTDSIVAYVRCGGSLTSSYAGSFVFALTSPFGLLVVLLHSSHHDDITNQLIWYAMNPNVFIKSNDRITLQKVLQKDRLYAQNTSTVAYHNQHQKREAQLSQRPLCASHNFVKSLKITQGHSKWHPWVWRVYPYWYYFHCNYVSYRFWDMAWPWNELGVVQGHWNCYHFKAWVRFSIRIRQ